MVKTGIGHDSHPFEAHMHKKLVLGGVSISGCPGLQGNSDGDVVLHAITNAVSGITGVNVLGEMADTLCLKRGVTDSTAYLKKALEYCGGFSVNHVSVSIEARIPKLQPHIAAMKESIAAILGLASPDIGITATTGEGMSSFGRGEGILAMAIVTAHD
ncbi:MAG: 2-C-methyl-D-erythritol 2,4-cyclodiphosphate synthase [Chitinivibrionales bacterium]|nr:2-C-methyl-D-erythritol 2,4-cyclodiphosphate synthase [Chitinivibrionales bacterium]